MLRFFFQFGCRVTHDAAEGNIRKLRYRSEWSIHIILFVKQSNRFISIVFQNWSSIYSVERELNWMCWFWLRNCVGTCFSIICQTYLPLYWVIHFTLGKEKLHSSGPLTGPNLFQVIFNVFSVHFRKYLGFNFTIIGFQLF